MHLSDHSIPNTEVELEHRSQFRQIFGFIETDLNLNGQFVPSFRAYNNNFSRQFRIVDQSNM